MRLEIHMAYHSDFAIFAQMTRKKHKAQSNDTHTLCGSEYTYTSCPVFMYKVIKM